MVVERFGQPLQLREIPTPRPAAGEVLVRVRAAGVCATDLKLRDGLLPTVRRPQIPGHEIAGEVVEVGPGVSSPVLGERVAVYAYVVCNTCRMCSAGRENLCEEMPRRLGFELPGGFAEYVAIPAANCLPAGPSVPFDELAIMADAVLSIFHALQMAEAVEGDWIAIIGVGGLGLHGVQLARQGGLRVVAVDRLPGRLELARELGAEAAVTEGEGWVEAVHEATGGGVRTAINVVGSPQSLAESLSCLATGGKLLCVAYSPGHPFPADTFAMHLGELSIQGTRGGTRAEFHEIIRRRTEGRLRCIVDRRFPLEEVNEALALIGSADVVGRSVVVPD